ncbi:hypothetical protein O181_025921 [Austropuccinia psidii MF-1]|uniref:Uncharacterized protein n=1 Tax=Austropuccinia psidii MF-1 TaxID=1389203 RepID=A0A9Q3H011_9BASI|nr:hypothetical protein [Austropuccinia psidii MF-1]
MNPSSFWRSADRRSFISTAVTSSSSNRQAKPSKSRHRSDLVQLSASSSSSPSITPTKKPRVYPIRKRFLFESYFDLLTRNKVFLLFRHDSLTPAEWNSIRRQLAKLSSSSSPIQKTPNHPIRVQVLRTKLILPVLKTLLKQNQIDIQTFNSISAHLNGPLVSVTQSIFSHPSLISKTLQIIDQHASIPTKSQLNLIQQHMKMKPNEPFIVDRLPFVIGLIDNSIVVDKPSLQRIGALPSLEALQQQILGSITSLASRLVSHLHLARGQSIVKTVDGFRLTLEKESTASSSKPSE